MPGDAISFNSAIFATWPARASSPSPVSVMILQSSPAVWLSRFNTVTSAAVCSSASFSSGTYRRTGASRSTLPSATRRISVVAVKVFVTEPSKEQRVLVDGQRIVDARHAVAGVDLLTVRPHTDGDAGNAELCGRRLDEIGQRLL